jgi:hypothetical protein
MTNKECKGKDKNNDNRRSLRDDKQEVQGKDKNNDNSRGDEP